MKYKVLEKDVNDREPSQFENKDLILKLMLRAKEKFFFTIELHFGRSLICWYISLEEA